LYFCKYLQLSDFFTNYLSHSLLSGGHNDSFNKYVKNIWLQKLPTVALRNIARSPITEDQTQQLNVTISFNKADLHMLHFNEVDLAWILDTVPNKAQNSVKDLDQS